MPSTLLSTAVDGMGPGPTAPTEPIGFALGTGLSFVIELAVVGILGAIVIAVAPDFTDEGAQYVRGEPVMAFVYGFGAYLAIAVTAFLFAITIVGLLVVVPGLLALAIVGVATTTVGVVALGRWIGDAFDISGGLGSALVVGVLAWALLGVVPVLGGLVTGALSAMGFGYLVARVLDGRDDGDRVASGVGGSPDTPGYGERHDPHDDRTEFDGRDEPNGRDEPDDRFRNIAAADRDVDETTTSDAGEDKTTDDADDDEPTWR
ncbi:hypothetical protein [Halorubrum laminariae]|uniref:DUF8173 domain-containing protein n=1 Tax=Halorubrum laminariae TaxID=1433523 RepID=A0ABD6C5H1_9EURY|nr:hypothetical protein [Halorubrum laminariae]